MFDRLKRSFRLVGASAQVLRQDKHLMLFPSSPASPCCWCWPPSRCRCSAWARSTASAGRPYSAAFLFYVVQYFVIFYFNTALVGAS